MKSFKMACMQKTGDGPFAAPPFCHPFVGKWYRLKIYPEFAGPEKLRDYGD
jgi:hypothetical protein